MFRNCRRPGAALGLQEHRKNDPRWKRGPGEGVGPLLLLLLLLFLILLLILPLSSSPSPSPSSSSARLPPLYPVPALAILLPIALPSHALRFSQPQVKPASTSPLDSLFAAFR